MTFSIVCVVSVLFHLDDTQMVRFWIFTFALVLSMLILFFVGQALHLPFLEEDTSFWLGQEMWVAALAGVALLIADVVAPVPSSIIMFANGVLFGPVLGALLSLVGGMGAAAFGYWIGTRGESAAKKWMGEDALIRANGFFRNYGIMAVIVSRPIPMLAEAASIIAGLSAMPLKRFFLAAVVGLLPAVSLYAIAGAFAVDLNSGLFAFFAVILLAGLVWMIGRKMINQDSTSSSRV